jgi:hypothetical protein
MNENGKMRPVGTILRIEEGEIKEDDGGVNLTKIYYKHFCKCHNVHPQYNCNIIIKLKTENCI